MSPLRNRLRGANHLLVLVIAMGVLHTTRAALKDHTPDVVPTPAAVTPRNERISLEALPAQVEADWLKQAESWRAARFPLTTRTDAAGACDGIKDGKYGFHTGREKNPWWQVDLGAVTDLARIVVFNRLDYAPGLHNADALRIFTSNDGQTWMLRHDNRGRHFGGVRNGGPLEVKFEPGQVRARFVRLQIPTEKPVFFHLDEVEIHGHTDPTKNLALHRPADQSSLSRWSTVKRRPGDDHGPLFPIAETIARGHRLALALQRMGADVAGAQASLAQLERRRQELGPRPVPAEARALYLATRRTVRQLAFTNPLLNFDQLLFVKRFTQETYPDVCLNHMPWVSRPGGDICILSSAKPGQLFAALAGPGRWGEAPDEPIRSAQVTAREDARPTKSKPDPLALTLRSILNRALGPGHVHGLDLRWDGKRVVFGYAKAKQDAPSDGWLDRTRSFELRRTEEPIHIFEVGLQDRRLRQLTNGGWSDLDPTYAPNGDIVFVSERCGTSLQCNEFNKDETSCNLYVMKPDGSGIRRLSVSKDGDYLPHTLDDGSIAYTRWEYHERSWAFIQSIWTVRPDGTGADAIFKQHFVNPWALEDTRSIPRSTKLVSIAAGHHTLAVGPLVVVDPAQGINEPRGIGIVTPGVKPPEGGMDGVTVPEGGVVDNGGFYSTPWALSEKFFLVAYTYGKETDATGYALYLVDVFGNKELVYRDPAISCFIPIPLRPRPRPPVFPDQVNLGQNHAVCFLTDASFGCDGIAPERVRYLRIAEPIGWPYDHEAGGQRYGEDHGYGGAGAEWKNLLNWTPVRILGDVPVEHDDSAHFQVPADTAVYFQLLDENRMELRRMRSFISFQPGEVRACVGCHESRGAAPVSRQTALAGEREPSRPIPPPWGDRPVSFLRDIQPVLDRHCVSCHSGLKPAGKLDFSGGLTTYDAGKPGYGHNRAYETIMENGLVSISQVRAQDASITPPLAYGSLRSKLIGSMLKRSVDSTNPVDTAHAKVRLSEDDRLRVVMWIDANAPYHDSFVNKRPAQPAYDLAGDWELQQKIAAVHERRCANCHKPGDVSRLDWIDVREPHRSLFLTAPLAKEAGGSGRCPGTVYRDVNDRDHHALRELVTAAVKKAWAAPRRDLRALLAEGKAVPLRAEGSDLPPTKIVTMEAVQRRARLCQRPVAAHSQEGAREPATE